MTLISRAGPVAVLALLACGAQAQTPEHGHYGAPGGPPHGSTQHYDARYKIGRAHV